MVNSEFCSNAELNSYINQSLYELYDLLTQKYGDNYYFSTSSTFTTDGTSDTYALPNDFFKLFGVDLQSTASPTGWLTLKRFNVAERNKWAAPGYQATRGVTNLRYTLRGGYIWLAPIPAGGQTLRLLYAPKMTELSADGDSFAGVSGWDEYAVVDAAIKAKDKEESDTSVLLARKQALIQRIESAAENRDAGQPGRIADTQNANYGWIAGDDIYGGWW